MRMKRPLHAVGHELGGVQKFVLRGIAVDLAVGVLVDRPLATWCRLWSSNC
jgi:hypothetical protein